MFAPALPKNCTKLLLTLLICTSFFAPLTPLTYAQEDPLSPDSFAQNPPGGGVVDSDGDGIVDDDFDPAEYTGSADGGGSGGSGGSGGGTGDTPPATREEGMTWLKSGIYDLFRGAGGMVTWVGGNMLDWAIEKLVLDFGRLLNENLGVAVNDIWSLVRDAMNIVFIFALIWIGLKTILNTGDSSYQKALGYLIMAALLINFSLFITKAVIDFSNIAAIQISKAFVVDRTDVDGASIPYFRDTATEYAFGSEGLNTYISAAFMESMKLSSYAGELIIEDKGLPFVIGYSILVFAMMVIAGFAFAAGAIMLITRFVVLVIVMMLSPIMFAGWIYPKLSTYSKQWADTFLRNAFIAPAYLFMLYIALAIIGNSGGYGFNNGAISDIANGSQSGFGIILHYTLVIGFLIAAVKVAGAMSTHGSNAVVKVGMAGANTVKGMGAFGYRNTVGRGANLTRTGMDNVDRRLAKAQERNSKRSNLNPVKWATGTALYAGREVAGGTTTRGTVSKIRDYNAGGRGLAQVEKDMTEQNQRAARTQSLADIKSGLKSTVIAEREQAIADMSNGQLEELVKTSGGFKLIRDNAGLLTGSHTKAILDSKDLNDTQKDELLGNRSSQLANEFITGGKKLKDASKDQLAGLGYEVLKQEDNAVQLKDDQIKNLDIIESQKETIKAAKKNAILDIVLNGAGRGKTGAKISANDLLKAGADDVASLPDEVFMPNAAPAAARTNVENFVLNLTRAQLQAIDKKKGKHVAQDIRAFGTSPAAAAAAAGTSLAELKQYLTIDRIGRNFGK